MKFLLHALLGMSLFTVSVAQESIPKSRVQFAKGASTKSVKGRLKGYQSIDYVVGAVSGQNMKITLRTSNEANYFNVIPPNEADAAIFVGSTSGNTYEGILPYSGDYKIRLYLMRSAARRNEIARYDLSISVAGTGK